jgi:uncharacterized protein YecA (UPF0149 family)
MPPLAIPTKIASLVRQTQANTLRDLTINLKAAELQTQQWIKQSRDLRYGTAPKAKAQAAQHSAGQSQPQATPRPKAETVSRPAPKIGRNEPCPCGSGQKFKRCCGNPIAILSKTA